MYKKIVLVIVGICLLINFVVITTASTNYSIESPHPYPNNYDNKCPPITIQDATQMRLHFEKLELKSNFYYMNDYLVLLDKHGDELERYSDTIDRENFWTDWFTLDTMVIEFHTDEDATGYGFKIDDVETRNEMVPSSKYPESYHSYANNFDYTWHAITKPGASRMRLHFEKLELKSNFYYMNDYLVLLDKNGVELKRYSDSVSGENIWTPWFPVDTIIIKFHTDNGKTGYGFKIDDVEFEENPLLTSNGNSTPSTVITETPSENSSEAIMGPHSSDLPMSDATTTLTSPKNQYEFGQPVTLTAKVVSLSQAAKEPYGSVTFMDGTTSLGTRSLISGQATLNTSSLTTGSHLITARYNGDGNCKPNRSSALTLTVLEQAPTNTEQPRQTETEQSTPSKTEPSNQEKKSIWENPLIILIVCPTFTTVLGAVIYSKVKREKKEK